MLRAIFHSSGASFGSRCFGRCPARISRARAAARFFCSDNCSRYNPYFRTNAKPIFYSAKNEVSTL